MKRLETSRTLLIVSVVVTLVICVTTSTYGKRSKSPNHEDECDRVEVVLGTAEKRQQADDTSMEDRERGERITSRDRVKRLVEEGVKFLEENTLAHACDLFSNTRQFMRGATSLFVFDEKGVSLTHGERDELIWHNLYDVRDAHGTYVVQELLKVAHEGGGWVSYEWRGATEVSYVQEVKKDGKRYCIGAGYYTHTKEEVVAALVRAGVNALKQGLANGRMPSQILGEMSYPVGRFVRGDLYLYVLDSDGVLMAHGRRPGLVGSNAWKVKDARGMLVNQEIINRLKQEDDGVWVEYMVHNAIKRAYAQVVEDASGKRYHVVSGYYPEQSYDNARELVRRASTHLSSHGLAESVRAISSGRDDRFREGSMYVVVYDADGVCIAHGGNTQLIGQNHLESEDEEGRVYVRELIRKARAGGGWVTAKLKHDFKTMYVERGEGGAQELIILAGFYPSSRHERMKLLVKSAASLLKSVCRETAFAEFTQSDGRFVQGDLRIFVFDTTGVCYAYGDRRHLIWRNLLDMKDDSGMSFVAKMIERVREGHDSMAYLLFGTPVIAHMELVTKGGMEYVVGSSYYE